MAALKILVIPGSLRTGSLNAKLAATIALELAQAGAEVTRISLSDFPLPIYDGDLQAKSGVPKNVVLHVETEPDLPLIKADSSQVQQVILGADPLEDAQYTWLQAVSGCREGFGEGLVELPVEVEQV